MSLRHGLVAALLLTGCSPGGDEPVEPKDTDSAADTDTDAGDDDDDGYTAEAGDCDDANPAVNPGADESCNGTDDDCDGETDGPDAVDALTWYPDGDADGWGTPEGASVACDQPAYTVGREGDCDDARADVHPDASEADCADPTDYNCDGAVGYVDGDGDGWAACAECDDTDRDVFPGAAETAEDGVDQDCDGWDLGGDVDGDGLDDTDEISLGTDPYDADSDDDTLSDGAELASGTDPLLADSDGDGWDDGVELSGYTDPTDATDHPYTGGWSIDSCRSSIVSTGTAVGDIAPNFELVDQHGDTVRLHDFCGRAVLLDFTEFW